jgi:hypothetical protein
MQEQNTNGTENLKVEKNDLLLIQDEIYKVVACYDEVKTPLTYDLQHIKNPDDRMMVTTKQMNQSLENGKWKIVEL